MKPTRVHGVTGVSVRVQNHDDARDGPLMTVPGASTYDAAELLLSYMHDAGVLPRAAVLEPLVAQAWLGNNVDLLHASAAAGPEQSRAAAADAPDAPRLPDEHDGPTA